jgi:cobalt-zinc-cadmium efflux system protein
MTESLHAHRHVHAHDPAAASAAETHIHIHGRRSDEFRLGIAFVLTAVFMVVEGVGGLWTGSLALLADAGHMLNDTFALGLALFALRMADRPADRERSYGYGRLQVLAAFANAVLLIAIALFIAVEAGLRVLAPVNILPQPMLIIAGAGLVVNLIAFYLLGRSDRGNLNIRGALVHVTGDVAGSLAAIMASLLILFFGWRVADPILSLFVVALMAWTAASVLRESGHILLEGTPKGLNGETVAAALKAEFPAIANIHHVHIWSLDSEASVITLHLVLKDGENREAMLAAAQEHLARRFGLVHATIQIEGGVCDLKPRGGGELSARCSA